MIIIKDVLSAQRCLTGSTCEQHPGNIGKFGGWAAAVHVFDCKINLTYLRKCGLKRN